MYLLCTVPFKPRCNCHTTFCWQVYPELRGKAMSAGSFQLGWFYLGRHLATSSDISGHPNWAGRCYLLVLLSRASCSPTMWDQLYSWAFPALISTAELEEPWPSRPHSLLGVQNMTVYRACVLHSPASETGCVSVLFPRQWQQSQHCSECCLLLSRSLKLYFWKMKRPG